MMHRTLYGVEADPVNLFLGGMRRTVADLAGCYMATDISDILFGIQKPAITKANLGTLKAGAVKIELHVCRNDRTLSGRDVQERCLWTDAFAVCN